MNDKRLRYALIFGFIGAGLFIVFIQLALAFSLVAYAMKTPAIEPMYRKPVAELSANLKRAGQERIAQGVQSVIARAVEDGKLFNARGPVMLTTNKGKSEWTFSALHDKEEGSTLLIGTGLERLNSSDPVELGTFDRKKAVEIIPKLKGFDPAYYPDEIRRLIKDHKFQRLYTGRVTLTTEPKFKAAMTPAFFDVLVIPNDGEFIVLVSDQYGACGKIAFGGSFSDKH